MGTMTPDRSDRWMPRRSAAGSRWVEEHAQAWVDAGIVSPEQVAAISTLEATPPGDRAEQGLSIQSEVLVYLGSLLALMSAAVIVGQAWDELAYVARLAIAAAAAVLGFAAGAALNRIGDKATQRLASYMWLIGTGGIALTVVASLDFFEVDDGGWYPLLVGLPVLAIGLGLWRNQGRPLQLLTTVVGAALTFGGLGALLGSPEWLAGTIVWAGSLAVGVLALADRIRPVSWVLVFAAIGAILGASMLTTLSEPLGPAVGAITSGTIVAVGLRTDRVPLVVIGVLGFLQALQMLLMTTLSGAAATVAVGVIGLVVVVVVLRRSLGSASG